MTNKQHQLLLIEDDYMLAGFIQQYLEGQSLATEHAGTAQAAAALLKNKQYNLIILDLNLPDEDGLVLLRKWQYNTTTPIVVVSSRRSELDKVTALELGAADYLTKPFSPHEFLLRVQRLLPQNSSIESQSYSAITLCQQPHLAIELGSRRLLAQQQELALTRSEFDILASLAKQQGKVVKRNELVDVITYSEKDTNPNSLGVLVHRLRKKLSHATGGLELIITVPNLGYRLQLHTSLETTP